MNGNRLKGTPMRGVPHGGWNRGMESYTSESSNESACEDDSPEGIGGYHEDLIRPKIMACRGSQGDPASDTESARLDRLGSCRTSTGTMKYITHAFRESGSDLDSDYESDSLNEKPFFERKAHAPCPIGNGNYYSMYPVDDNDVTSGDSPVKGKKKLKEKKKQAKGGKSKRRSDRSGTKSGISSVSIEDILEGKVKVEVNQKKPLTMGKERSVKGAVSDAGKDELLFHLLKEHMRLTAKLEDEPHVTLPRKGIMESRNEEYRDYKPPHEVYNEEKEYFNGVWKELHGVPAVARTYKDLEKQIISSKESSPLKGVKETVSEASKPRGNNLAGNISSEADLLQNEIEELIGNLENVDKADMDVNTVPDDFDTGYTFPMDNKVDVAVSTMDEPASFVNEHELVKPVKVPLRPPMPEHCDVGVLTNETARVHALRAYERLNNELQASNIDSDRAHQTDNTRITSNGIAWDITEYYLKEEERKMLQEKKKAELLEQLKRGPPVKSDTLRDHYNRWVQKRCSPQKGPLQHPVEEEVGEAIIEQSVETPSQELHLKTPVVPASVDEKIKKLDVQCNSCCRNIFRRNIGNRSSLHNNNCDLGCDSPALSGRSEPIRPVWNKSHQSCNHSLNVAPPANVPRDVYIKGTWNPNTGALKISNDLDKSDKTKILDEYLNFLKQNPGNSTQELMNKQPCNAHKENIRNQDTEPVISTKEEIPVIRIHEEDLKNKEKPEHMPHPEAFYNMNDASPISPSASNSPTSSESLSPLSSDTPRRRYERDELYPPDMNMPLPSPPSENSMPHPIYPLGFRDPYMPNLRHPHVPYLSPMPMQQYARNQTLHTVTEHHHHYHCGEKSKKTKNKKKSSSSKHKCDTKPKCGKKKKKSQHKRRVEVGVQGDLIEVNETKPQQVVSPVQVEPEVKDVPLIKQPVAAVTEKRLFNPVERVEVGVQYNSIPLISNIFNVQSRKEEDSNYSGLSSPSFGSREALKEVSNISRSEEISTIPMYDISRDSPKRKSTDYVMVTTYYPMDNKAMKSLSPEPLEKAQLVDTSDIKKDAAWFQFLKGCCEGQNDQETETVYDSFQGSAITPTICQSTPSTKGERTSDATIISQRNMGEFERKPQPRKVVVLKPMKDPQKSSPANSPHRGYFHVFSRRAHPRNELPSTSVSPLKVLEKSGSCEQIKNIDLTNVCQYEFETDAETSDQFTFRATSSESPQRTVSPPMYKTRLIYVGGN